MNTGVCGLLPHEIADGPQNMAADDAMIEGASHGVASLRFYGWNEATVSLGYFQAASARLADPLLASRPFVRRPTGGAMLLHHHEVTYALAVPPGLPWHTSTPWLLRMHDIIATALDLLGAKVSRYASLKAPAITGHLCFQHWTPGDLIAESKKITGSAQRKQRGALLQHGSILLAQSPYSPMLPGLRELTGKNLTPDLVSSAILDEFARVTGWQIEPAKWTEAELQRRHELVATRYANTKWNEKR
jgi:lipoyl(octanoyl) transferase